jgi:hypothetical protein
MACLIPAAAPAAITHPLIGTFGSAATPSFTEVEGLAVDQATGDVLVLDRVAKTVSRWHADGTPADFSTLGTNVIGGFTFDEFSAKPAGFEQVAVDNSGGVTDGDIYVADGQGKDVRIFASDGTPLGTLTASSEGTFESTGSICGVTVDPSGNVYVGQFSQHLHKYEPSANPPVNADNHEHNFSFEKGCNLAAGAGPSAGSLFATHLENNETVLETGVAKLDSATGDENYNVDPGPAATVSVDPANGHLFIATGSEVREYDASGPSEPKALVPVAPGGENVTGVAVDGATGDIYVARQNTSHLEVWGPAVQLPEATSEEASVIADTVTFHGAVSAAGGPPASCVFQYVQINAEGFNGATSVPCSPAGPFTGTGHTAVTAEVKGLPEAAYRYRLLASNEDGTKTGGELLFNTFETLAGLPDNRVYELVSPPAKAGEVIPPEPEGSLGSSCSDCLPDAVSEPMQSTPGGGALLYQGQPFSTGLAAGPSEYVAQRTAGGWITEALSSASVSGHYVGFSSDFSRGVLEQREPALSPLAPTRGGKAFNELYLQQGGERRPLVTAEPPDRVPSGENEFKIRFAGANAGTALQPGFGHVLFEADDSLTGSVAGVAPVAPEVPAGSVGTTEIPCSRSGVQCDLYESEGAALRLVNVLPGNTEASAGAVLGAGRLLNEGESPDVAGAVSADGSRIFWTAQDSGRTYARIAGTETLEIPGPGNCRGNVLQQERVCFLTASPDGSRVLLSDGHLAVLNGAGTAYEASFDLTAGQGGFQGILGASEDLSRVYFVDTKVLTGANAEGKSPQEGGFNAYAWHEGGLVFIGTPRDGTVTIGSGGAYGNVAASASHRTAQVSADGRFLAFMSLVPLTGYDNAHEGSGGSTCDTFKEPHPGVPCQEVFEYDALTERLSCASCDPSGQQPIGPSNLSLLKPNVGIGAPLRQPSNLSPAGEGRLFFESQDVLSRRDTNGAIQDVYEFEPGGVDSCKREAGCVYLISSGASANDSMFLDSSANGDNAFFITRAQLLPQDKNEQLDVYDARVGGGIATSEPEPCAGEACAQAPSPSPLLAFPASSLFSGLGNLITPPPTTPGAPKPPTRAQKLAKALKACARKPKRARPACRRQAHRQYGSIATTKHSPHKRSR